MSTPSIGSEAESPLAFLRGGRVYFDANVFIYRVEAEPQLVDVLSELWAMVEGKWLKAVTSELSLAESLISPIRAKNRSAQASFIQIIGTDSPFQVVPVSRDILLEAARIRALHGLEMPDAIHAATAKITRCTHFLTADVRLAEAVGARAVDLNAFKNRDS